MKLIALEASSDRGSAALWVDGEVAVRAGDGRHTHSELMLPWVGSLLAEAGLSVRQLDALAFGSGPGSFTGLRLACGAAQGLALAADLPAFAIGSLDAMALGSAQAQVYVCVDARMNGVYCAAYECRGIELATVIAPLVCAPEDVPLPAGRGWFGCGDGFATYDAAASRRLAAHVTHVDAAAHCHARNVARLAALRYERGERPDAATAAPLYVRNKVAFTTAERRTRAGAV